MSMREDLRAAGAAREELGDGYEAAVTRSLLERLDREVDARVDDRLRRALRSDIVTVTIALFSIGLGVVFALVAERLGDLGGTIATIVAWLAIVAVNVAHARRR